MCHSAFCTRPPSGMLFTYIFVCTETGMKQNQVVSSAWQMSSVGWVIRSGIYKRLGISVDQAPTQQMLVLACRMSCLSATIGTVVQFQFPQQHQRGMPLLVVPRQITYRGYQCTTSLLTSLGAQLPIRQPLDSRHCRSDGKNIPRTVRAASADQPSSALASGVRGTDSGTGPAQNPNRGGQPGSPPAAAAPALPLTRRRAAKAAVRSRGPGMTQQPPAGQRQGE